MAAITLANTLNSARHGRLNLALNILVPIAACLAINAVIYATGMTEGQDTPQPWFAPPGWVIGMIWVVLFGLYGTARWAAIHDDGARGRYAAKWITFLMGWSLAYPFLTFGFDIYIAAMLNVVSLLFNVITLYASGLATRRSFWLLIPSCLWVAFATFLGFYTISHL